MNLERLLQTIIVRTGKESMIDPATFHPLARLLIEACGMAVVIGMIVGFCWQLNTLPKKDNKKEQRNDEGFD